MEKTEMYDSFEDRLEAVLVKICTEEGLLGGQVLASDDLDGKWHEWIKSYLGDAISEYNSYPEVAFAWAGYIGLGLAKMWDVDWEQGKMLKYTDFYGPRGFDDMDDFITEKVLGFPLGSPEAGKMATILRRCADEAISLIRHDNVEAGSVDAFHVFVCGVEVLRRIGSSIGLFGLGYRLQRIQ